MKAIQIEEFGGPEVLRHLDLPDPEPADGEVLVEVSRAGVNFADTHAIRDDYLARQALPLVPGGEIAGRAPDGRRVAALVRHGGYAERVAVPASALVPIPPEVSDDQAAGLLLQGLTARSILRISAKLQPGESVVVGAAAGGTGSLAVQLAKRFGAGRVIALASSERKRELALRLGADAAVDSRTGDLRDRIVEAPCSMPASPPWLPSGAWSRSDLPRASRTRCETRTSCGRAAPSSASGSCTSSRAPTRFGRGSRSSSTRLPPASSRW